MAENELPTEELTSLSPRGFNQKGACLCAQVSYAHVPVCLSAPKPKYPSACVFMCLCAQVPINPSTMRSSAHVFMYLCAQVLLCPLWAVRAGPGLCRLWQPAQVGPCRSLCRMKLCVLSWAGHLRGC